MRLLWGDILTTRKGVIGLLLIAAVTYTSHYAPIVYMDDWSQIVEPMTQHTLSWVDWTDRRPLLDAPLQILQQVFGLNIDAFYLVAWLVTALSAVQLYWLIRQFKPAWQLRAWAVAALALVYPADFAQMWLAHVLHARIGWWLTLVAASCLLTYVKRHSIGWLVAATALSLIALLLYEGQLGVFIAFGLLVIVSQRAAPRRTRLMLLIPIGLNGLYLIWRSVGFRVVGIQDQYLSQLTLNIGDLANRLRLGFQVLWWSWTGPVGRWLEIDSNWLILLILLSVLSGLVLAALWWAGRKSVVVTDSEKESVTADWYALLVGAGFIVAGYFPTISLYEPNLNGVFTRVNFYALPGAAVCMVAILSMVIRIMVRGESRRWRAGFITAMVALIGLGMVIQVWVRRNAEAAWQEQQLIWAQLFELAPQLQPGTVVCFVLPDYQDQLQFANWWRTPLSADWEVSAALRLLYDAPTLRGEVVLPKVTGYGEATLRPAGVQNPWTGEIAPYADTVFLRYDKSRRQLTLLTDVAQSLDLEWPVVDYDPSRHIVQGTQPEVAARHLLTDR